MRYILILVAFAFSVAAPASVSARDFRVGQIPNAPQFGCETCHEPNNKGYVNPFGVQVLEALTGGDVVWAELAALDADGDGYSNGLELGDPDGNWRTGDPHPGGQATHPGIYESNLCGNGVYEDNEECEDGDVGDATCADFGFHAGAVRCNTICQLDTAGCINCGNGLVDPEEECEGADLDGRTCGSLGYDGGTLGCKNNCTIDTRDCEGEPTPICGDGIVVGSEDCEGENLGGATCESVGYVEGGLLLCDSDCTFDTDRCLGVPEGEDEATPVPGNPGPALPPSAFADEEEGCSTAGGFGSATASLILLALVSLRRRKR